MLKNYLTVALRTLSRQKGYAAINVAGLALGLACCFLIVLFIQHERSFDTYHENGDRTYLVTVQIPSFEETRFITPAGLAPMMEENIGGVEHVVRLAARGAAPVRLADGTIKTVDPIMLADPSVFEAFSVEFLQGDPATALADPSGAVLTESVAKVLFGSADPMGQSLTLVRQDLVMTVTGVIADLPANTHLNVGMLGSFTAMPQLAGPDALTNMSSWNYLSYAVLHEGTDPEAVAEEAASLVTVAHEYEPGETVTATLRPLPTLHFDTEIVNPPFPTRDPRVLWIFAAIAALILLVACINFTNLATARATQRAREVGVRKSLGSGRGQLIAQFLGESLLLSVIAIGIGIAGAAVALPLFNDVLGGKTALSLAHPGMLASLVGIGLVAGLIAGSYPALYLTRFDPAPVLKGDLSRSGSAPGLRKGLVVFQFTVSAFLIVATLTVMNQLRFMRSQDLGFAQEQVITFEATPEILDQVDSFKQSLRADPSVVGVAMANGLPGRIRMGRNYLWPTADGGEENGKMSQSLLADPDYLDTVGLELADGRWFREGDADVGNAYILNETAVREMGIENPVGHAFRAWDDEAAGTIIGVVKDFHFTALQQPIEPLVIAHVPDAMADVTVRFAAGSIAPGLDHLQRTYASAAPGYALDYHFLDEAFEEQYREEVRLSTLLGFFAGVAIFIACLGIFGLAALAAERRRKEIGVRKVLGASTRNITTLLAREFVALVGLAFLVAAPLAYLAMSRWLEGFAYAVGLGPGVFAVTGVAVLVVALVTVSVQAFRAAAADPIQSLRYE